MIMINVQEQLIMYVEYLSQLESFVEECFDLVDIFVGCQIDFQLELVVINFIIWISCKFFEINCEYGCIENYI